MKIAPDKWRHFFAGIAMGLILQGMAMLLIPGHRQLATVLVFVTVVIISYGFELFSKITGRGYYEIMDAVATIVGGALGMMAVCAACQFG